MWRHAHSHMLLEGVYSSKATVESNLAISGKFEDANSSFVLRYIPRETLIYMLREMCMLWCARANLYQLKRPEDVQLFLTLRSVMLCL